MAELLRTRYLKYGSNTVLLILIVLGIVVVINFLSARYHYRYDVTAGKIHSLSDQTISLLKSLKEDVKAIGFFQEGQGQKFKDMAKEYAYYSRRFSYEFFDPDKKPGMANRYKIRTYGTTVITSGEKEEKITGQVEKDLTNAIAKVIREEEKVIYFTMGHGEVSPTNYDRDGYSTVKDALEEINYVVRDTLLLARERRIPGDCSVLVIPGPKTTFFPEEVNAIRSYLEWGGKALFLLDPGYKSGLEEMLAEWSILVGDDFVVDGSGLGGMFGLDYTVPIANKYGRHVITAKHRRLMTFYPLARSVSLDEDRESTTKTLQMLVQTSNRSWAEQDLGPITKKKTEEPTFDETSDKQGPVSLGAVVKAASRGMGGANRRETGIVVFGDSDFASNQYFRAQGNGDLFMNSISWLAEEEDLIAIRPKEPGYSPINLTKRQGRIVFWLSVVAMPVGIFFSGILVWWRRR